MKKNVLRVSENLTLFLRNLTWVTASCCCFVFFKASFFIHMQYAKEEKEMKLKPKYALAEGNKVTWSSDGLLFFLPKEKALIALNELKENNYHVVDGDVGFGLYQKGDKTERCLAEEGDIKTINGYIDGWWFNPSCLHYIKSFA